MCTILSFSVFSRGRFRDVPPNLDQLDITPETVRNIIQQSKRALSPCGIFSLRNEFLKDLIGNMSSPQEEECLHFFTWLFPVSVMSILKDTQGATIPKKNGGTRPLGLRDTYISLASKAAMFSCKETIEATFKGVNYALAGKKKMDELIAIMMHSLLTREDHDRIFIDATNAFNRISRKKAFDTALRVCPQLATLIHSLYGNTTRVWVRGGPDDLWTFIEGWTGSWKQACLPVNLGGCGLDDIHETAIAAFTVNVLETHAAVLSKIPSATYLSFINCAPEDLGRNLDLHPPNDLVAREFTTPYREFQVKIDEAMQNTGRNVKESYDYFSESKKLQHYISSILAEDREKTFRCWLQTVTSPTHHARFLSCKGSLSGAWLYNVPKDQHNSMPPNSFINAFLLRIGECLSYTTAFCMCFHALDRFGIHLLSCPHFRFLGTQKHDLFIHELKCLAIEGDLSAETHNLTEFRALNPVNGKRPDLRIRGLVEKNILIDATFGDPRCKSHIDHSNSTHVQGGTVERLCKSKIAKYGQHCDDINAIFHPAAFEIFGSTSHETEELIAKLVRRASEKRNIPYPNYLSYWRKRISTTIQRGNHLYLSRANTKILGRLHRLQSPSTEMLFQDVLREPVHLCH